VLVLLIDRNESAARSLQRDLEKRGFEVRWACSGKKAVEEARQAMPDLVIIEASSLKTSGEKLALTIRRQIGDVPILWLISPKQEKGNFSVDSSFLVKPFSTRKLLRRIRKALQSKPKETSLQVGEITLDLRRHYVIRKGEIRALTPKEFRLLETLMRHPGQVLTRKFLMKTVWDTDYLGDTRTLDVHIHWVRKKIEDNPASPVYLRTVRGVGYRFEAPPEEAPETTPKPQKPD